MSREIIEVYCPGVCLGHGTAAAVGGWGAVLKFKGMVKIFSGGIPENTTPVTRHRAELLACLYALQQLKIKSADYPIVVFSDSKYLIDHFSQKCFAWWENNGWRTVSGDPIANMDLWRDLIPFYVFYDLIFEYRSLDDPNIKQAHELAQKEALALAKKGAERGLHY